MVKVVALSEAQKMLRELAEQAENGLEIVLTDRGRPVARLLGPQSEEEGKRRIPGLHPGALLPSEDFDAPLPDEHWFAED